ncbi:NADH-quinone oxidoreductase subunit J [Stutzerimonas nosocomialis]|uniref:NADH-quinone oxidoreductase subunit J n=2 Tax=Stutzerimonas nosocomialis TaxID=1056496 RepID=A0A5R9QDM2_9GAMM|nr:proton-conducting transporter membrane subunit [Stutzerimonas nosocomialis]TLX58790.1 NADH-quinone oxidoreductase subunit J [Stutzerimonas nosocomialis]TLX63237.1 NADH-quinone oxidoreductase subunit J [Stutzerimonas nosocomialis]
MNLALLSLALPLVGALLLVLLRPAGGRWVILINLASTLAAAGALHQVMQTGAQWLELGGWSAPLAIRFQLTPLAALLLLFTAGLHLLVALYAARSRHAIGGEDFWPLSCLLQAALAALWLSGDLFNLYVTLELLSLAAVALVALAGAKAYRPALNYLLLSLAGSLAYLFGVALLYGRYGVLDIVLLGELAEADATTRLALLLMSLGLMLKAALWPLHLWLPPAHAGAPAAVSALLSALVVKGPLYILWLLWSRIAPVELAQSAGGLFAVAGIFALLCGGWSALRAPYLKTLVAYSTVAQLGYALLALGLLLRWQEPGLGAALWLFVLAHGLAKVSMFLAAGELQHTLGSKRVRALKGASQTMPLALFAFAVAGGSLIGLPPSGGFLAKWLLLQPLFLQPQHWPWAIGVLLGTLASAAYVFRVVALGFDRARPTPASFHPDRLAQWLAMLPALLVWCLALISKPLLLWIGGVSQ